jgi:hypothetical protein
MKINDVVDAKLYTLELIKDSPLFLYVAFYEPLHNWLSVAAEEWNPVFQLVLNILALVFGIARLIPVFKNWFGNPEDNNSEDNEAK